MEYVKSKKELRWMWDELPLLEIGKCTITCSEEDTEFEPHPPFPPPPPRAPSEGTFTRRLGQQEQRHASEGIVKPGQGVVRCE